MKVAGETDLGFVTKAISNFVVGVFKEITINHYNENSI
jgi:hypothetical protein